VSKVSTVLPKRKAAFHNQMHNENYPIYHKDTRKMRLANFLYVYGYAVMQVCLDRP